MEDNDNRKKLTIITTQNLNFTQQENVEIIL